MKYENLELKTLGGKKVILKSDDKSTSGFRGANIESIGDVFVGGMNIPIKGVEFSNKVPSNIEVDENFSYENFSYGYPARLVILSKESSTALRKFAKEKWDADMLEIKANKTIENDLLAKNVDGLEILRDAYQKEHDYITAFNRAMENEYNDGVNMPISNFENIKELEKQFPRAELYLKAERYSLASNFEKSLAGDKAKEILKNGGCIEDAKSVLENWLKN